MRRDKAGGELAKNGRKKLRAHLIFKLLIQLKNAARFRPCLKDTARRAAGFPGGFLPDFIVENLKGLFLSAH